MTDGTANQKTVQLPAKKYALATVGLVSVEEFRSVFEFTSEEDSVFYNNTCLY